MKYRTIVIDPPWDIGANFAGKMISKEKLDEYKSRHKIGFTTKTFCANVEQRRSMPYEMISDKDVLEFELPIQVDDDACLWMWCVHQKLELALQMIQRWDFDYKYVLTWHKQPSHMRHTAGHTTPLNSVITAGFWRNSELLLFATRGKSVIKKDGAPIPFVFAEKMRAHSVKPSGIYQMIRDKTPEPRIDIFARRRHAGFDAWGDQVEKEMQTILVEAGRT